MITRSQTIDQPKNVIFSGFFDPVLPFSREAIMNVTGFCNPLLPYSREGMNFDRFCNFLLSSYMAFPKIWPPTLMKGWTTIAYF